MYQCERTRCLFSAPVSGKGSLENVSQNCKQEPYNSAGGLNTEAFVETRRALVAIIIVRDVKFQATL